MKKLLLFFFILFVNNISLADRNAQTKNVLTACHMKPFYYCRAGSGEVTLLFIHGLGGRAAFWKHQLAHFSSQYTVITVDLPGHGQSVSYNTEATLVGLSKALSNLMEQLDLNNTILIGHDMGAYIGLSAAVTQQGKKRVSALIAVESLVDTKVVMPKSQYQQIRKRLRKNFTATALQMTKDLFSDDSDLMLVDWISSSVAATNPEITLSLMDDFIHKNLTHDLSNFDGSLVILNTHLNPPRLKKLKKINTRVIALDVPWQEHYAFIEQYQIFNQKLLLVLNLITNQSP